MVHFSIDDKHYIKHRLKEILDCYLMNKDETFCMVKLYFEKSNGEHQEKCLILGKPSKKYVEYLKDFMKRELENLHRWNNFF